MTCVVHGADEAWLLRETSQHVRYWASQPSLEMLQVQFRVNMPWVHRGLSSCTAAFCYQQADQARTAAQDTAMPVRTPFLRFACSWQHVEHSLPNAGCSSLHSFLAMFIVQPNVLKPALEMQRSVDLPLADGSLLSSWQDCISSVVAVQSFASLLASTLCLIIQYRLPSHVQYISEQVCCQCKLVTETTTLLE